MDTPLPEHPNDLVLSRVLRAPVRRTRGSKREFGETASVGRRVDGRRWPESREGVRQPASGRMGWAVAGGRT